MMHYLRTAAVCSAVAFLTSTAFGQSVTETAQHPPSSAPESGFSCSATFGPVLEILATGADAPFSAVRESSTVRTLADGTHISPKPNLEKIYRDSQGRYRSERPMCGNSLDAPDGALISIRDPVAGYAYVLDQQNHVAYRYVLKVRHPGETAVPTLSKPASTPGSTVTAMPKAMPEVQITSELLGSQSIEGVMAEGTRITRVVPVGTEDNDRPITIVSEGWFSPEIRATVLAKTNDPRRGDSTMRLTNIDRAEPDISLFQPPPDYKIEDTTDRVTIKFPRP